MARGVNGSHQHKFSVPAKDESVLAWLAEQDSVSASLRLLIRDDIARHGITDTMCRPPVPHTEPAVPEATDVPEPAPRVRRRPQTAPAVEAPEPMSATEPSAPATEASTPATEATVPMSEPVAVPTEAVVPATETRAPVTEAPRPRARTTRPVVDPMLTLGEVADDDILMTD